MGRVIVRGELRREPVPGIGKTGADRDEQARAARATAESERNEREHAEDGQRRPHSAGAGVSGRAMRRGQCEHRHPGSENDHRNRLRPAHLLVQIPGRDREQEDHVRTEQRLDERERRVQKRERLQAPADEAEYRPGEPAWPAHEPPEERQLQRLVARRRARLDPLQRDPDRVESGGPYRRERADEQAWHPGSAR